MVARALITTAIEETWPEDKNEPILFLGEWCKLYNRKSIWGKLNANTEPYHWDDREKIHTDYLYLEKLYEELIVEIVARLNEIHSVNHSVRYWKILIGPWLGCFIQILFDRWFMLKQAIEKLDITACKIIKRDLTSVIPNDMSNFNKLFTEDDWNEAIYGQLLEKLWPELILIKKVQLTKINKAESVDTQQGLKVRLKSAIQRWIVSFNTLLPRENKYFFISTYLPLKIEVNLQVRLGQFPRLWKTQPVPVVPPVRQEREWRLDKHKAALNSFDEVVRNMIPLHIPTAYLEGYEKLIEVTKYLPWGSRPKAIFTSNSYSEDDIFKAWAAGKTELQVPLIIGQHGGHFGMTPFSFYERHQIEIASKWLSWGWSDPSKSKIIPVGMLGDFRKTAEYDPKGGALMIETTVPRYSYSIYAVPVSRQWLDYFNEQQKFLNLLPYSLKKQVLLRLSSHDYGWNQAARWHDKMPEVQVDAGHRDIGKLISKSRLCISTYNATTYLETLNWNIPTIVFWNPKHWELKEGVSPYFDVLKDVGIFHETPESAAKHMIKVWSDVSFWWESDSVQKARLLFCKEFARQNKNLSSELERSFLKF